ncbi:MULTISPECIES: hypothetical protein [Rhizobium]|nr:MULTISPECIES: hypothetical protein [Rhizobium]
MSMGRFVPRKEFALLTPAIAKLPGVDGEERKNVEKVAADLGIVDRVRFLGWQKDARLSRPTSTSS